MLSREDLYKTAKTLGGMPVLDCMEGSPSYKAGIRYGDIILSVNDLPVSDITSYLEAKNIHDGAMNVVVFRDGVTLSFDLVYDTHRKEVNPAELLNTLASKNLIASKDESFSSVKNNTLPS